MQRGGKILVNNRLVQIRLFGTQRVIQRKRVSKDCPFTKDEITAYAEGNGSTVKLVAAIRDGRKLGLHDALNIWSMNKDWLRPI